MNLNEKSFGYKVLNLLQQYILDLGFVLKI
jgi:hypothetical protein